MKIVYFAGGKREKTLLRILTSKDFKITHLILAKNESYKERYINIARKFGIILIQTDKKELTKKIRGINADIFLSVGFRYILPKEAFVRPKFAVNVHPTLLPKYRGAYSGNYILINNEKESGITVHFIAENADTGDIILQKSFPLSIFDSAQSLARKTYSLEPSVVMRALKELRQGTYKITKQKYYKSMKLKKRTPEDSRIDPNKPIIKQYNLIRASHAKKYPAFFYINKSKVILTLKREKKPWRERDMI